MPAVPRSSRQVYPRVGRPAYVVYMLTDRARAILRFEESWEGVPGNREAAIRDTFGVSPARYFQELHALIERPEALAADPVLVKRLARLRDLRRRERSATPSATLAARVMG